MSKEKADIVIIGAGPVGLWVAIQAKKRNKNLNITVYERYEEYKRSHVLRLEHASLRLYSKKARDQHERSFYQSLIGQSPRDVFSAFVTNKAAFVRTNEIETALKTYAKNLGIDVQYQKIDSPEHVESLHPDCKYFIAADGAHSQMRQDILGEDAIKDSKLQYVVEIKYEAEGNVRAHGHNEVLKLNKKMSSMAFEYIGREKNGKTPVTLRFFVDEDTYKQMPEASFKEPLKIDTPNLPPSLKKDIDVLMTARKENCGEEYIKGSDKMSKLTLSLYKAKKFAVKKGKNSWFLAGDAAMGVPYFRSLNAGLIIGSQLGKIITDGVMSDGLKRLNYNALRPLDVAWEFTAAHAKNMGLKAYDGFRRIGFKRNRNR